MTKGENLVNFSKFLVFFKVDEDPELYEIVTESICKGIKKLTIDDLLTVVANMSQTLSPTTTEIFRVVNEELCVRLSNEHNPTSLDLVVQPEDLIKITTNLLRFG